MSLFKKEAKNHRKNTIAPEIEKLKRYGGNLSNIKVGVRRNINDASGLEKEFLSIFKKISNEYIKAMETNISWFSEIYRHFKFFLESCERLGYKGILSQDKKSRIDDLRKKVDLRNLIIESKNILGDSISIELDRFEKIIDCDFPLSRIKKNLKYEFSNDLIKSLDSNIDNIDQIIKRIHEVQELWEKNSISLFNNEQKDKIERLRKIKENKKVLKSLINKNFKIIREFDPQLPKPEKYPPFADLYSDSSKPIDSGKILLDLYNVYEDVLVRNPKKGDEIVKKINSYIEDIPHDYNKNHIDKRFNKIKNNAFLKVKLLNLFMLPKKGFKVILEHNSKEINSKNTDDNGEVLFENVPREKMIICLNKGDKEKKYEIKINNYYNKKLLWLFSL